MWRHSHKKRKDSVEGSLSGVLSVAELEFRKIRVPRLLTIHQMETLDEPENQNWTLYFLCDLLLAELKYLSFYYSGINLFLIDYAYCKLCNIWLLLIENNSRSSHCTRTSHWRKNIVAVISQGRVIDDNLKR